MEQHLIGLLLPISPYPVSKRLNLPNVRTSFPTKTPAVLSYLTNSSKIAEKALKEVSFQDGLAYRGRE